MARFARPRPSQNQFLNFVATFLIWVWNSLYFEFLFQVAFWIFISFSLQQVCDDCWLAPFALEKSKQISEFSFNVLHFGLFIFQPFVNATEIQISRCSFTHKSKLLTSSQNRCKVVVDLRHFCGNQILKGVHGWLQRISQTKKVLAWLPLHQTVLFCSFSKMWEILYKEWNRWVSAVICLFLSFLWFFVEIRFPRWVTVDYWW